MDGDPLSQCFAYRFAERVIEVSLATQDERKVIDEIITIVHEHLDIIQDPGAQVLGLINGKEQGLFFLFFYWLRKNYMGKNEKGQEGR